MNNNLNESLLNKLKLNNKFHVLRAFVFTIVINRSKK